MYYTKKWNLIKTCAAKIINMSFLCRMYLLSEAINIKRDNNNKC